MTDCAPEMNLLDFVRQEMGDETLSDDACDLILWEHTAFPAGGVETIRRQIREFRETAPAAPVANDDPTEP